MEKYIATGKVTKLSTKESYGREFGMLDFKLTRITKEGKTYFVFRKCFIPTYLMNTFKRIQEGDTVCIMGTIEIGQYTNKNGEMVPCLNINATEITIVDSVDDNSSFGAIETFEGEREKQENQGANSAFSDQDVKDIFGDTDFLEGI